LGCAPIQGRSPNYEIVILPVGQSRHRTSGGIAAFFMILPGNEQTRIRAVEIIQHGGIIAFRTDTFYGLGVDPFNQEAIRAIRRMKGREENKPILILIANASDADRFITEKSAVFDRLCQRHWPGPLTLIGKARPELPEGLTAGTGTIGIRLPADADVRNLLRACGGALTATSANLSGQPPARTAQEVESYFPTGIDLIIDGGEVAITQPSTVLDLSGEEPRLIREGAIKLGDRENTRRKG
jgi:L-threonylcarbamoyladenylate synthase